VRPLRQNANPSSRDNLDWKPIEIDLRDLQSEKHDSQITKTDAGRSIDVRPLQQNASRSIRDNFEFASYEIETSDPQRKKQPSQTVLTEDDIQHRSILGSFERLSNGKTLPSTTSSRRGQRKPILALPLLRGAAR
jgi:hypothetical protein